MKGWRDVSARVPCVGCGRTDWCQVSDDGEVYACHREPSSTPRVNAAGEVWLHFTGSGPRVPRPRPELPPPPPCADDATRDRVYRALLGVLEISDDHRAGLVARGLTAEQVERGGYATMPPPSERPAVLRRLRAALDGDIPVDVPGIHSGKLLGAVGLAIPVRDHEGRVVAIKVRADSAEHGKYLWLSSVRQKGPGPGAPCHVPAWRRSTDTVRVTEGPLKADVATRLGQVLTIGVPGVTAVRSAVPALRALSARLVVLAWDSDARTNAHVGRSLARAVEVYREEGFAVAVETWAADHKGIDDALAAGAVIVRHEGDDVDGVVRGIVGVTEPVSTTGDDWQEGLYRSKGGAVRNTFANLCAILRHDAAYRSLRYNGMTLSPEIGGTAITDARMGLIREEIEHRYGFGPSAESVAQGLLAVASEQTFHPVQEYLGGIAWDGVERLTAAATDYLGAASAVDRTMLRAWFVSAVARALAPGCKVDTVLVLVGPQGFYKSTFFDALAGPGWFTDSHVDLSNKDVYLQLARSWIVEWGEIERITGRRGSDEVKSFLSSRSDTYRPPYGRAVTAVPRSCVIVGSTNEDAFLQDPTGSRRFWCLRVMRSIDTVAVAAARDQLWAEAVAAYRAGEPWWLGAEAAEAQSAAAEAFRTVDPWEPAVAEWLATAEGHVTTTRILGAVTGLDLGKVGGREDQRVAAIMRRLGWSRRVARVGGVVTRIWERAS